MITIHPQYIKDAAGQNLVVLPQQEFDKMLEELEELEDTRLFDEAQ
jgi:PHD/YefM family antitoxin component YafN of YafNO toxin-antitoxin module